MWIYYVCFLNRQLVWCIVLGLTNLYRIRLIDGYGLCEFHCDIFIGKVYKILHSGIKFTGTVEIDESVFGHTRKYRRGHGDRPEEGILVFGITK